MAGVDNQALKGFSRFCIVQDSGTRLGSHAALAIHSVYQGLPNMNVEYMKRFLKYTKAADKLKRAPTTEKALFTVIARHFVPTLTPADIDAIFDLRPQYAKKVKAVKESQFLSDNLEHGYGCVDESDYRSMTTVIDEHKSRLQEATKKWDIEHRERPSMIGFVAPVRENGISLEWAHEWMPCYGSLTKDTVLH